MVSNRKCTTKDKIQHFKDEQHLSINFDKIGLIIHDGVVSWSISKIVKRIESSFFPPISSFIVFVFASLGCKATQRYSK